MLGASYDNNENNGQESMIHLVHARDQYLFDRPIPGPKKAHMLNLYSDASNVTKLAN